MAGGSWSVGTGCRDCICLSHESGWRHRPARPALGLSVFQAPAIPWRPFRYARQEADMTVVYFDSPMSDDERRDKLFSGDLFVYSPTPQTLALVEFAQQM